MWQMPDSHTFAIVSGRAMRVWGGSNYSVCNLESPFAGTFSHAKLVQATFPTPVSARKHDSLDALTLTVTTFVTCA